VGAALELPVGADGLSPAQRAHRLDGGHASVLRSGDAQRGRVRLSQEVDAGHARYATRRRVVRGSRAARRWNTRGAVFWRRTGCCRAVCAGCRRRRSSRSSSGFSPIRRRSRRRRPRS
jgi:hypothetical protein